MRGAQRAVLSAALVSLLTTTSGLAQAEEWYGYKILAGDGAAATLLVSSAFMPKKVRTPVMFLSLATYLVVSPIVHATEERGGVGAGALGLRIAAPVGLGFLGAGIGAASTSSRGLDGLGAVLVGGLIGFGFGVIGAIAIDTAALARTPAPRGQLALGTAPAALAPSGFYLPLAGTF